jgi:hypothetical protein
LINNNLSALGSQYLEQGFLKEKIPKEGRKDAGQERNNMYLWYRLD